MTGQGGAGEERGPASPSPGAADSGGDGHTSWTERLWPRQPSTTKGAGAKPRSTPSPRGSGSSTRPPSTKKAVERLDDKERRLSLAAAAAAFVLGVGVYLLANRGQGPLHQEPRRSVHLLDAGLGQRCVSARVHARSDGGHRSASSPFSPSSSSERPRSCWAYRFWPWPSGFSGARTRSKRRRRPGYGKLGLARGGTSGSTPRTAGRADFPVLERPDQDVTVQGSGRRPAGPAGTEQALHTQTSSAPGSQAFAAGTEAARPRRRRSGLHVTGGPSVRSSTSRTG